MSALLIGLTGGIGSGKSAATELFRARGITVVDADEVAHEVTAAQGAAMPAIAAAFGDALLNTDGSLNRGAMRQHVFSDPAAKAQLEGILHPMIRRICDERCRDATSAYAVLAVPLFVESGHYRQRVQRLLVVDCPEETQISRVMARNNMTRQQVLEIMQTQATREQRLAAADDVVDNNGDLAQLEAQIEAVHQRYLAMADR